MGFKIFQNTRNYQKNALKRQAICPLFKIRNCSALFVK